MVNQEDNVQSMRDQGIADACAGRDPVCWITRQGDVIRRDSEGVPRCMRRVGTPDYREAFAYARAYEANK